MCTQIGHGRRKGREAPEPPGGQHVPRPSTSRLLQGLRATGNQLPVTALGQKEARAGTETRLPTGAWSVCDTETGRGAGGCGALSSPCPFSAADVPEGASVRTGGLGPERAKCLPRVTQPVRAQPGTVSPDTPIIHLSSRPQNPFLHCPPPGLSSRGSSLSSFEGPSGRPPGSSEEVGYPLAGPRNPRGQQLPLVHHPQGAGLPHLPLCPSLALCCVQAPCPRGTLGWRETVPT